MWEGGRDVFLAAEPVGAVFDVVVAGEEDVPAFPVMVEEAEIAEVEEELLLAGDGFVVDFWGHVVEVFLHVAGPEFFAGEKVDERGVLEDIVGDVGGIAGVGSLCLLPCWWGEKSEGEVVIDNGDLER